MAKYDQKISVKVAYVVEAKKFLGFLQEVGKQPVVNVKITFIYLGKGLFYISTDNNSNSIDILIQELLLNKGLYYFAATLSNKKDTINNVILPILQQITNARFANPQSRFLRNHILGKHAQTDFIPSDLKNKFGYSFEVLFRKWQLKIISDKDYVIELDTLLHHYLLHTLKHTVGKASEEFGNLLKKLDLPFALHPDFINVFLKIHSLRTASLHRLQSLKPEDILDYQSSAIYNYFQFLDEYAEAQKEHFFYLKGKQYKRLKYGFDGWDDIDDPRNDGFDWKKFTKENPCHDCFVKYGYYHIEGCDVERCPNCRHQLISCECEWDFYDEENV